MNIQTQWLDVSNECMEVMNIWKQWIYGRMIMLKNTTKGRSRQDISESNDYIEQYIYGSNEYMMYGSNKYTETVNIWKKWMYESNEYLEAINKCIQTMNIWKQWI